MVLLFPFDGWERGGMPWRLLTVGPHPKSWTRDQKYKKLCQRWLAGEVQLRVNPEGSELDTAVDDHSRCKKNSSI